MGARASRVIFKALVSYFSYLLLILYYSNISRWRWRVRARPAPPSLHTPIHPGAGFNHCCGIVPRHASARPSTNASNAESASGMTSSPYPTRK